MIVNVCPSAVTPASAGQVWKLLTWPQRYGEWVDAEYVSSEPLGPILPGQVVNLSATALGRRWPVKIEIRDLDPQGRWIDMVVHLPFGVVNHEHITLNEVEGGTLVRFN